MRYAVAVFRRPVWLPQFVTPAGDFGGIEVAKKYPDREAASQAAIEWQRIVAPVADVVIYRECEDGWEVCR